MDAFDSVGETCVSSAQKVIMKRKEDYTSYDHLFPTPPKSLHQEILTRLKAFFDANHHRPSEAMWTALTELASVLEKMAEGRCPAKIYLSSLDPGVGKTQTVIQFIRALMASKAHQDVGVLICMSRLEEIKSVVEEMALSPADYAVLTSNQELNKRGAGGDRVNEARVLFTTQQRIEKRGTGCHFAEMDEFHFLGRPRQVRIWDESILPGQTVTLNRYDLASLLKPLCVAHPALAEVIEAAFIELLGVEDGAVYQLPDFKARCGLDLNELLRALSRIPSDRTRVEHEQALTALWLLAGKTVSVRQDGFYGNTMLDYHETLPEGLAPLVVLDASGRVRGTYRQWEENRGGVERLASASKSYKNLTVHCWRTSGGKSAFRQNGRMLIDGIAETINDKRHEEWLVIYHQDGINMEFMPEVEKRLTGNKGRVHFLHWGEHQATNKFGHVPNVILAGTLFYRLSYYEALARLAADRRPAQGIIDPMAEKDVMIGEHRHLVLQALCRGSVRRCQGDVCAPCNAYIIASTRSGIPEALREIFPDCHPVPWNPVQKPLSGKVNEAAEFVIDWFEKNPNGLLRFNVVQRAIGMEGTSNFRRDVRQNPEFRAALDNYDIAEAQMLGDSRRGFLKPNFVEGPSVE
jgi:hypothetical protein